jgi:hypothetical protein
MLFSSSYPAPSKKARKTSRLSRAGMLVFTRLLQSFFHSDSNANGHADHGVVTSAQEAHHLNVSGHGGGASELSVAVHTAHGMDILPRIFNPPELVIIKVK